SPVRALPRPLVVRAAGPALPGGAPGAGGAGMGQPALPGCAGRGWCPGDMMIDWVSPPAGMRPLSLIRPSAWPWGAGPAAADSGSAGAGRGGTPSGEFGCGMPGRARLVTSLVTMVARGSYGGERVVAELGQDVAGLPDDLAGLGQGGALAVLAVLDSRVVGVVGGGEVGVDLAGLI